MSRLWAKALTAESDTRNGTRAFDFLRYVTIGDGRVGRTTHQAFLSDTRADKRKKPSWAGALLEAGRGTVTTQRRDRLQVRFRLADEDEREQAVANINEIRLGYGTRSNTDGMRVILAETDGD